MDKTVSQLFLHNVLTKNKILIHRNKSHNYWKNYKLEFFSVTVLHIRVVSIRIKAVLM